MCNNNLVCLTRLCSNNKCNHKHTNTYKKIQWLFNSRVSRNNRTKSN